MAGCELGEKRCGGELEKTPEICSEAGEWVVDNTENEGDDCPFLCVAGACQDCSNSDKKCDGNVPQTCEGGTWQDGTLCASYCLAGECRNPPSCAGTPNCTDSTSCCSALEVEGGTFTRDFDNVYGFDDSHTATVSSFLMDEFEVTVGRLDKFVEAYPSIVLQNGDGAAPHIAGDLGWQESYPMPADVDALKAKLSCEGTTWNDDLFSTDQNLPANCVDWYLAYAFCIWDGGRLPTEAEWNYAAAGGDEQRAYPWSDPPGSDAISEDHAAYLQSSGGVPLPVGSKSLGNGRWGQADLAGNVYEWNLDYFADTYASDHCEDCLVSTGSTLRSVRGGAFDSWPEDLLNVLRNSLEQDQTRDYLGFRCVHDIEVNPTN
jgi:formylglycine-generating enzyme required for sulfatase activity